jgi:DNA-binding transcriptional LysR family regulator
MNLHRLDLVSLSLFCFIVRTGSISKGAELASLVAGAASKRITDLEAAIGTEVFERHSRGVKLTAAGEALLRHAQRILADVDQLAADLSEYASGAVGAVRLWANTSAITQFLGADLASFVTKHPGIGLHLYEANSAEVQLAVMEGRADLGILGESGTDLGLETVPYRSDRLVVVVPEGHPLAARQSVSFNEAIDYEFVSLTQQSRSLAELLALHTDHGGKPLRQRVHVRSFETTCLMVAAGLGIAVIPEAAALPHLKSKRLRRVRLTDQWGVKRELRIGARSLLALPKPARTLLEHLCGPGPDTPQS